MTLIPMRGNGVGLAMVVAGLGDALVMELVGVALIAMDLRIRLRRRPAAGWLTRSEHGGYLFFLPVWGWVA